MSSNKCTSITWEIANFKDFSVTQESPYICHENEPNASYLFLEPCHKELPYICECILIHLRHSTGNEVNVLCSISIVDQNGSKSNTIVSSMFFDEHQYSPIKGGLYLISRSYLLDPKNGLLIDGKLTIHCEVEILGDEGVNKLKISYDDTKINLVQKKAFENYQSLLESGKLSDVVFVFDQKELKLHKTILSAQSPVFSAMFESNFEESKQNRVEITDVDVKVFEVLIAFIYSGNVERIDQFALELFVVSDKYQLDSLKDMCAQSLGSNLTVETVAHIFLLADMHSSSDLKSKCIHYISQNCTDVMVSDGWKLIGENIKSFELMNELYRDLVLKSKHT